MRMQAVSYPHHELQVVAAQQAMYAEVASLLAAVPGLKEVGGVGGTGWGGVGLIATALLLSPVCRVALVDVPLCLCVD